MHTIRKDDEDKMKWISGMLLARDMQSRARKTR